MSKKSTKQNVPIAHEANHLKDAQNAIVHTVKALGRIDGAEPTIKRLENVSAKLTRISVTISRVVARHATKGERGKQAAQRAAARKAKLVASIKAAEAKLAKL